MARIFKFHFSLRKVLFVVLETAILSLLLLPVSDFEMFGRLLEGETVYRTVFTGPHRPAALSELSLLAFMLARVLVLVLICQGCFFINDLYNWKITANRTKTYIRLLESVSYALIVTALAYFVIQGLDRTVERCCGLRISCLKLDTGNILLSMVVVYLAAYLYRILFHWSHFTWRLADRLLLVGTDDMTERVVRELKERNDPSYEIVGYVVKDPTVKAPGKRILGGYEDLFRLTQEYDINRVIVSLAGGNDPLPADELLNCRIKGIRVEEAALLYERITGKIAVEKLDPMYLIFSEGFDQYKFTYVFKRILDVGLAVCGLILSLPIILVTAVLIKLDSRGPVFFKQQRVGKEGKIFTLVKFRSMYVDAEEKTGPVWATKDDKRVTRVGRVIRRLRIDEIPQMWNVLRNEMSFVGPRPERPYFVDELKKEIPFYTVRLVVKPGITGWAQTNYVYGSSKEDALEKLQYDLYYIKNMSIILDVVTLLKTVKVVIRRQGAV